MKVLQKTLTLANIEQVGGEIIAALSNQEFCLWLIGDLGAGKTTLTKTMLKKLGLDPSVAVTSPTYTIMNEYQIGEQWYAHLDLYRASAGFNLEELGLSGWRSYRGVFVEWPEKSGDSSLIKPTHRLEIIAGPSDSEREITLLRT